VLTLAAPALFRALQGQLPQSAVQALAQTLMNCNQPLEHRAPVAFSRPAPQQSNGVVNSGAWNPADYPELFPDAQGFVEMPGNGGYRAGDWYSTFYGSPSFDLRTELQQNLNQYYSGPTIVVQGDTLFDNMRAENQTVTNLTVENINGEPAPGAAGAAAPAGPQGARGLDGAPGPGLFFNFNPVFNQPNGNVNGRLQAMEQQQWGMWLAIRDLNRRVGNLRVEGWPQGSEVLQNATFDPDACDIRRFKSKVRLKITGNR
jgi:hypothetical protein